MNQKTDDVVADVLTESISLKKAITAYGEATSVLEMRAANTNDARTLKALPYTVQADETVSLNLDVCAKYISRLCNIPMSSVDSLDLADFNQLAWSVARFFLDQDSGG